MFRFHPQAAFIRLACLHAHPPAIEPPILDAKLALSAGHGQPLALLAEERLACFQRDSTLDRASTHGLPLTADFILLPGSFELEGQLRRLSARSYPQIAETRTGAMQDQSHAARRNAASRVFIFLHQPPVGIRLNRIALNLDDQRDPVLQRRHGPRIPVKLFEVRVARQPDGRAEAMDEHFVPVNVLIAGPGLVGAEQETGDGRLFRARAANLNAHFSVGKDRPFGRQLGRHAQRADQFAVLHGPRAAAGRESFDQRRGRFLETFAEDHLAVQPAVDFVVAVFQNDSAHIRGDVADHLARNDGDFRLVGPERAEKRQTPEHCQQRRSFHRPSPRVMGDACSWGPYPLSRPPGPTAVI